MEKVSTVSAITNKTLVPISLVATLLGGSGWLTKQHITTEENSRKISEIRAEVKIVKVQSEDRLIEILTRLERISNSVSKIEGKLERENSK